jgi:purine-binding chemotaxis protein CheW
LNRAALIVNAGPFRCALPLCSVAETMRPLPIRSFSNTPAFVCGASIIRGEALPVVDLARLLGAAETKIGRFVVIRVDPRKVALAVETVVGVKELGEAYLASVPPLLQAAHPSLVDALGTADEGLLLVLNGARMLPDEAWTTMEKQER